MQIKQLIEDDDAVSPVIGVILMVAITVILAAVIGTFVLGLGDQVSNTSPSASFTFDYTEGNSGNCDISTGGGSPTGALDITHDGGDSVTTTQMDLKDDDGESAAFEGCFGTVPSEVTSGDTASATVESDDTVRVVWEASGGGDTSTLGKWTGPDA